MTHALCRRFRLVFGAVLVALALVACGDTKNTTGPASSSIGDVSFNATATAIVQATVQPTQRPTRSVDNFNATSTALAVSGPKRSTPTVSTTAVSSGDVPVGCPKVSSSPSTRDVVCTFHDSQGHTDYLYYGRGNGHSGDFGWAHIKGKHINGIWYDGGIITTYPQAFGTTSDLQVLALINKALQDPHPKPSGDRFEFRYRPSGSRYDVLAVVGSDGTIITAYPEG